jgi:hypothetical protein
MNCFFFLSGRLDSNQRPHAPQTCALPGCATSRSPVKDGKGNGNYQYFKT